MIYNGVYINKRGKASHNRIVVATRQFIRGGSPRPEINLSSTCFHTEVYLVEAVSS